MQRLKEWYDFKRKGQGKLLGKELAIYLKHIKKNPHTFEQKIESFRIAPLKIHQVAIAYILKLDSITIVAVYSTYMDNSKILKF